jgi:class 3 adenylate cyclase
MAILYDDARGMMPGILVQAHSISQLLDGRSAERPSGLLTFLFSLIFAVGGVAIGLLKRSIAFSFLMGIIVLTFLWLIGMLGYAHGLPLVPLLAPSLALALSLWMMDTFIGKAERKQKEFIQGAFSRYVSPAVVEQLVDNPAALSLTGKRQEASFLFTDIAEFTSLSEKLSSDRLSNLLNAYLNGACEIIQKHQGTIDKFIGDAIMAVFNAPLPQADHQERAVRCALELDTYAERFRATQNENGIPLGVTRIGLHSGTATIGNFGSQARMDFTALGDTVNIAARTEGVNKYFGTRICCTQEIMQGCPNLLFLPVGEVVLKGKEKAVALYQPIHNSGLERGLLDDYNAAYLGLASNAPDSDQAFERLRIKYPQHPLIEFYWKRIRSGNRSTRILMDEK